MKKLLTLVIASASLAALPAMAANDGSLGATSTGDLDINLTVSDIVQISKLTDITLAQNAGGGAEGTSTACVYANGDGKYNLLIAGSSDANGDTLQLNENGVGTSTVDYSVDFSDGTASTSTTTSLVGAANAVSGFTGNATSADCAGGTNATISVSVAAADYQAAVVGTYSDTLVLTVAPE